MRISDWSSDVCSSDLLRRRRIGLLLCRDALLVQTAEVDRVDQQRREAAVADRIGDDLAREREQQARSLDRDQRLYVLLRHIADDADAGIGQLDRSEEHTSELQSLMRTSYAVFCLQKKNNCSITLYGIIRTPYTSILH